MALVSDLRFLIQSYIPLKVYQLLNDSGYVVNIKNLLHVKYNLNQNVITNQHNFLTDFERYTDIAMLNGEIGYNGQFYLPPYVALLYAIRANDLELINYYLFRYFVANNWLQSMLYLFWSSDSNRQDYPSQFLALMLNITTNPETRGFLQGQLNSFGYQNKLKIYNAVRSNGLRFLEIDNTNQLALYDIDPNYLDIDTLDQFPPINPVNWLLYIKTRYGAITKDLINQANIMLQLISKVNKNDNYILYTTILKILLNLDINIDSYHTVILDFALSVANGKVIKTLVNKFGFNQLESISGYIPSEVLYDVKTLFNTIGSLPNSIILSIFLTDLAYQYLPNLTIPIVDKYNNLLKALNDNYYSKIYDLETALRLSQLIDVKPFLQPMNQFDKKLMQQYGLE